MNLHRHGYISIGIAGVGYFEKTFSMLTGKDRCGYIAAVAKRFDESWTNTD